MLEQIEGSQAVARAVALCRPEVIAAYPISPQTHIVEGLADIVRRRGIEPCEYINVESEFAAMSVAIGASASSERRASVRLGRFDRTGSRPARRTSSGEPGLQPSARF